MVTDTAFNLIYCGDPKNQISIPGFTSVHDRNGGRQTFFFNHGGTAKLADSDNFFSDKNGSQASASHDHLSNFSLSINPKDLQRNYEFPLQIFSVWR